MYPEDELLPLSGLQHLEFCERQWALIHLERAWEENALTAQGRVLHERVHGEEDESRVDVLICRGLPVWSTRLGLYGFADVVEFHRAAAWDTTTATGLPGREGRWRPFPVEYKRGRPKSGLCDEVQLCAQAMCLEERFGLRIARGALYYGQTRHRAAVEFAEPLRRLTESLSARMHQLFRVGTTPAPVYGSYCEKCSLRQICLPRAMKKHAGVEGYLAKALSEVG